MPYHRLYFSAIAMRSAELPQVTAYWLMLPWIAAHAASFIGSGIGKSGKPCARLTASCWLAMRVISRMTDSVNVEVRRAASIRAWLPSRNRVAENRRAKYRRRSERRKAMGGPHREPPMVNTTARYGVQCEGTVKSARFDHRARVIEVDHRVEGLRQRQREMANLKAHRPFALQPCVHV